MKRIYSVPAALVGAFGLVALGSTVAQAASTDCTTDLGDQTITGDLVVPAGADCVLAGATVEGSITVGADAWLDATSVTVTGDVVAPTRTACCWTARASTATSAPTPPAPGWGSCT